MTWGIDFSLNRHATLGTPIEGPRGSADTRGCRGWVQDFTKVEGSGFVKMCSLVFYRHLPQNSEDGAISPPLPVLACFYIGCKDFL